MYPVEKDLIEFDGSEQTGEPVFEDYMAGRKAKLAADENENLPQLATPKRGEDLRKPIEKAAKEERKVTKVNTMSDFEPIE